MAKAEIGSNSGLPKTAKDQLKAFIDRIETIEGQKAELASDLRDVYTEAASNGFDKAAIRIIIRERKQDQAKRLELEAVVDTYKASLGMLADMPLGQAAIERAQAAAAA